MTDCKMLLLVGRTAFDNCSLIRLIRLIPRKEFGDKATFSPGTHGLACGRFSELTRSKPKHSTL